MVLVWRPWTITRFFMSPSMSQRLLAIALTLSVILIFAFIILLAILLLFRCPSLPAGTDIITLPAITVTHTTTNTTYESSTIPLSATRCVDFF